MMALPPVASLPDERLLKFLDSFPSPTTLRCRHKPDENSYYTPWVFWSQEEDEEGSSHQIHSSSSSAHHSPIPYDKILSAFSNLNMYPSLKYLVQLWAPVTIGSRRLLSTSAQPFALNHIDDDDDLKRYRLGCMKYQFNIDHVNNTNKQQLDIQQEQVEEENGEQGNPNPKILSGGPAAAFLNRMPEITRLEDHQEMMTPLGRYALDCGFPTSFMLPICYPSDQTSSSSSCIGVLELSLRSSYADHTLFHFKDIKRAVKKAGLSIYPLQESIPYKTINGLKPVRDHIEAALKTVCGSHNLLLSQVWIPFPDENHASFSSSLEDTRMKRTVAIKLTGYVDTEWTHDYRSRYEFYYDEIFSYYDFCDVVCLKAGVEIVEKTLQDYKPRLCKDTGNLNNDTLMACAAQNFVSSVVAICLRSIDTGDLDYAFEFLWHSTSNDVILFEALLLTLKRCLPSFKFASGVELGDQLEVQVINELADSDAENSTDSEIESLMIFQGKKSIVVDSCKAKWKTAPKELPREVIEEQFGNTMKNAADNLKVSLSTLKRKCKDYHIYEWQGPNFLKKGKVNGSSSNNQSNDRIIEEDNGAIQEPSVVNRMENTLTIKAEYAGDTIKFDLCISEATLANVEKEIGINFNLTVRSYKLNYLDEDGDWILLGSDQHMKYCINRLRNSGQTAVRLRVIQFPQQPSSNALTMIN